MCRGQENFKFEDFSLALESMNTIRLIAKLFLFVASLLLQKNIIGVVTGVYVS